MDTDTWHGCSRAQTLHPFLRPAASQQGSGELTPSHKVPRPTHRLSAASQQLPQPQMAPRRNRGALGSHPDGGGAPQGQRLKEAWEAEEQGKQVCCCPLPLCSPHTPSSFVCQAGVQQRSM